MPDGGFEGHAECGTLSWHQSTPEARPGQRREQFGLAAGGAPCGVDLAGELGSGVERVEPDRTAGSQGHRAHAPGRGQVCILAFRVDHPGPTTEDGLAPEECLDEGALAPADLPEDHHVGIRDHALGVQLEGIEHE